MKCKPKLQARFASKSSLIFSQDFWGTHVNPRSLSQVVTSWFSGSEILYVAAWCCMYDCIYNYVIDEISLESNKGTMVCRDFLRFANDTFYMLQSLQIKYRNWFDSRDVIQDATSASTTFFNLFRTILYLLNTTWTKTSVESSFACVGCLCLYCGCAVVEVTVAVVDFGGVANVGPSWGQGTESTGNTEFCFKCFFHRLA